MIGFVMAIHALICIFLAAIILMQSGKGGGLTEQFSSAESLFGAQTNTLMVKATTVLVVLFFVTCLSLAILSAKKDKSLMLNKVASPLQSVVPKETAPVSPASAPAPAVGVPTPEKTTPPTP